MPQENDSDRRFNLQDAIGLGVAGNFAGHLDQAGEAGDFAGVATVAGAPKGVFPFYVPGLKDGQGRPHPLSQFCISSTQTVLPINAGGDRSGEPSGTPSGSDSGVGTGDGNPSGGSSGRSSVGGGGGFQVEPEIGLWCELVYDGGDGGNGASGDRSVRAIRPQWFGAFNDCSHRRPGALKLSQKKNWGAASKGFAVDQLIPIDRFEAGGVLDRYRLVSFLKREGELVAYGEDAGVPEYAYIYGQLLDWLVERMNHQQDVGPLESIAGHLKAAGYPEAALIAIGATRYTGFGETHRLQPGEVSYVVAYDGAAHTLEAIKPRLLADDLTLYSEQGVSVLRQTVVGADG